MRPNAGSASAAIVGASPRRRAYAYQPPTAAASAAIPPSTRPARGPAASASQPTSSAPIGVEPRKTTE
jgi:hypothetical protein